MGDDETVDFESLKMTMVFWNIDDYPVDTSDDLSPIFGDMVKALNVMGFRGFMDVKLYYEQVNYDIKEPGLNHHCLSLGEDYRATVYKVPDITWYMIRHASVIGNGPVNIFLIAKPKRELHRVLQCLKSRRHNVLLVEPTPPDEEFLFSVDSLLENSRLLGGGKPRFKDLYPSYMCEYHISEEQRVEIKEDVSKMVDFSERIPTVKGPRTAVFWDAVACPLPLGSTPDKLYHSISSALVEREFSDNITIWAYLDDDDKRLLGHKTWASRIYFLPGGDKASRRVRMLNDIYLWKRDSPLLVRHYEASLLLFSDQFNDDASFTGMLQRLANMHYDLLLVTPTLDINKPESPEWPGLLIDGGGYLFDDEAIRIPQEPSCPTQHAADATAEEETPEKLATHGSFPLETEDIKKLESPEWQAGSLLDRPFGDEASERSKDTEDKEMLDSLLWEPLDMNKLKSSERRGWKLDGGPGCESSEEPCPKKEKAEENT